ncbi:transcription antiterminator [Sporosarcina sp. ANT_H38]|uniref:BglG family transcription antiterminator n=1 Tax=Sporosarcina sp. ANT_H38 TaxID=2597358 RepID=UPI0011F0EC63|nr:HTH domain-containing protein [Sporosarcina sp. ANT_H38]KAA0966574.1 transcription antiterminator [Sporosarcina sp. ANT_H38]
MLTIRGFRLLTKLLETNGSVYLKDLSEEFDVSTRMIKYDLDDVKGWLSEQGIEVFSKSNKGIWIDCEEERRLAIIRSLSEIERNDVYLNQEARVGKMIMYMLVNTEHITASSFSERLDVSRNTSLNDIKQVDELLKPWGIELEKKHRVGYKLVGEELSLRLLFEHLIHADLTNSEVYKIMSRVTCRDSFGEGLLLFSDVLPLYEVVEKHMAELFFATPKQVLHESDVLRILFRLTISITRMNARFTMNNYRILNEVEHSNLTVQLMEKVYQHMQYPLFEEEYRYVLGERDSNLNQIDIVKVTKEIIQYVSEIQGVHFHKDPKLYNNLFAHLSLRFHKGEINFTEINPFTKELKREHSILFSSIQKACQMYLVPQKISVPDSFISLIVLHFIVSFEKRFNQKGKIRTLYVCSTGRGVARLIKNRVEREIYDIDIVKNCSIMEVDEICVKEEVDLIISVFPIETDIPIVIVDPLPSKRDIETIKNKVKELLRYKNFQFNNLLESTEEKISNQDTEFVSQEIILKGFEINQEIQIAFADEIEGSKKQALMLHISLMVHRYYFDKQYDNYSISSNHSRGKEDIKRILEILDVHELQVNEAEIFAILQYFK